jgi:uncharacterized ubiquitin-like protein YukD
MAKTHINVTIDHELYNKVKENNLNISNTINEYLWNLIAIKEKDLEAIKINQEKKALEIAENKLKKWQLEAKNRRETIKAYEEMINKKRDQELKRKEEQILNQKRCLYCGVIMEESHKKHKTASGGYVCHNCFMAGDVDVTKV